MNHSAPSGPAAIPAGAMMLGSVKLVTVPAVVIRPIESFAEVGEPQRPVGPRRDRRPASLMLGSVKLVTVPSVVIRPIESFPQLVNHSAPSGPATIPSGSLMLGSVKLVTAPPVVIRPIEPFAALVNHSAPSGPAAIPSGSLMPVPVKLVTVPTLAASAGAANTPTTNKQPASPTSHPTPTRTNPNHPRADNHPPPHARTTNTSITSPAGCRARPVRAASRGTAAPILLLHALQQSHFP